MSESSAPVGSSANSTSRPGDQAAGQRDPLGLPAGQLAGAAPLQPVEAEPWRTRRRASAQRRRPADAVEQQRQGDVLLGGQLGHELAELEHEAEPVAAQRAARGLAERVDPAAVEVHLAGVGHEDPGQAVQQRRLAGPARPHDGEDLAGRRPPGRAAQRRASRRTTETCTSAGLDGHASAVIARTSSASASSRAAVSSIQRRSASRWNRPWSASSASTSAAGRA